MGNEKNNEPGHKWCHISYFNFCYILVYKSIMPELRSTKITLTWVTVDIKVFKKILYTLAISIFIIGFGRSRYLIGSICFSQLNWYRLTKYGNKWEVCGKENCVFDVTDTFAFFLSSKFCDFEKHFLVLTFYVTHPVGKVQNLDVGQLDEFSEKKER